MGHERGMHYRAAGDIRKQMREAKRSNIGSTDFLERIIHKNVDDEATIPIIWELPETALDENRQNDDNHRLLVVQNSENFK